jgi:hypothetical protein
MDLTQWIGPVASKKTCYYCQLSHDVYFQFKPENISIGLADKFKNWVESSTEIGWDWGLTSAPIKPLENGMVRRVYQCVCVPIVATHFR